MTTSVPSVAQPEAKKPQRSDSVNTPSEVRTAYPFFHEKRTKNAAGKLYTRKDGSLSPRFNVTLMFPKLSTDAHQCANYMFLWGLACQAGQRMWPTSVNAAGQWVWPEGGQFDVQDGDVPYKSKPKPGIPAPSPEEVAKKNAWRCGYWIVECDNFFESITVAKVINGVGQDLPSKIINKVVQYKSGDWGFANINAYAYENETYGVNFGFSGFLFTREGELIGAASGPKNAGDMFGSVANMAAPAAALPGVQRALPPAAPGAGALAAPVAAPVAAAGAALPPPPPPPPSPAAAPPPPPAAAVAGLPGLPPIPSR